MTMVFMIADEIMLQMRKRIRFKASYQEGDKDMVDPRN